MWPPSVEAGALYWYLCAKNETMAPLHVATLTVQRELPKYEIIFSI